MVLFVEDVKRGRESERNLCLGKQLAPVREKKQHSKAKENNKEWYAITVQNE